MTRLTDKIAQECGVCGSTKVLHTDRSRKDQCPGMTSAFTPILNNGRLTDKEREAVDALNDLVEFAYKHGYHELGYDPVKQLVSPISAQVGGLEIAENSAAAFAMESVEVYRENNRRGGQNRPLENHLVALADHLDFYRSAAEAKIAGLQALLREYAKLENQWDHGRFFELGREARALIETSGGEDANND